MKQFTVLCLLAILAGCTGSKRADDSPIAEVADSTSQVKEFEEVELLKTRTGHITASLIVNGKPCTFLIDTGGGATIIDKSKKKAFGLESSKTSDYAAGIGSASPLTKTSATFQVNGYSIEEKDLYLMDISFINTEFRKNKVSKVDGVLGTDFLDKHKAIIDYSKCKMYLNVRPEE